MRRTFGLLPTPPDHRDKRYGLTINFGAPSLQLPKQYDVEGEKGDVNGPRQQGQNLCAPFTISEIGADEHGIPMSAEFSAAMISLLMSKPVYLDGSDMRKAMESGKVFGFLPLASAPFTWEKDGLEFICDPANWSLELMNEARKYRMRGGYFGVDGPYDAFDNLRAQIFRHKPDNGVALGIPWYDSFNDTPRSGIIPEPSGSFTFHAIDAKGFRRVGGIDIIRVRSWDDKQFGDSSYAYFTRERFNKVMKVWGAVAYMYKDVPEDYLQSLREEKATLLEVALNLAYKILFKLRYGKRT